MDGSDSSVSSVLPPYNTIHAQLVTSPGTLLKNSTGNTVTYQAVADPDGSINKTSVSKANFWQFVVKIFGKRVATYFPEAGFAGTDTFTFAAWDGSTNSNLGLVTITVRQGWSIDSL
jgi:hypothetical protein